MASLRSHRPYLFYPQASSPSTPNAGPSSASRTKLTVPGTSGDNGMRSGIVLVQTDAGKSTVLRTSRIISMSIQGRFNFGSVRICSARWLTLTDRSPYIHSDPTRVERILRRRRAIYTYIQQHSNALLTRSRSLISDGWTARVQRIPRPSQFPF
jgi:hypothetical protein